MRLRIKEYREEFGWTQKELAEKVGSSQRNISNWESGASEPDYETLLKLAYLFDISMDDLFGCESFVSQPKEFFGVELSIMKEVKALTDAQKSSLLQFLREMKG